MKKLKLYALVLVTLIGLAACSAADVRNDSRDAPEYRDHERHEPGYMRK